MARVIWGVLSTSRPVMSFGYVFSGSLLAVLLGLPAARIAPICLLTTLLFLITFTSNDLIDAEQDRKNHPKRFLVIDPNAKRFATIYYLGLVLAYCLVSGETLDSAHAWAFTSFLAFFVSYSFVKANAPLAKNIYISLVATAFFFVSLNYLGLPAPLFVAGSAFAFGLSRELLMDVPDIPGDHDSIAKRLGPYRSAFVASALSGLAALILALGLLVSRPLLIPIALALPLLLLMRLTIDRSLDSTSAYVKVATALPFAFCLFLVISA